jgi:hypothetical protein
MSCLAAALLGAGAQAGTFNSDFSDPAQPGISLVGGFRADGVTPYPAIVNGVLVLTYAEASLAGMAVLDNLDPGSAVSGFNMTFKVRIGGGTSDPADGMSVYFGSEDLFSPFGEEGPDGAMGLVIAFDTFNNGEGEAPAIDVRYGGNLIGRVPYTAASLQSDTFTDVSITLKPNGTLDMTYKGQTVFSNLFIPGYEYAERKFAFGARTGGAWSNHWIDDLAITTTVAGAPAAPSLTLAPQSQTVNEHDRVVFTALPAGTPPFEVEWLVGNTVVPDVKGLTYVIPSVSAALNGANVRIRLVNSQGPFTSEPAVLTVNADTTLPTIASVRGSESFREVTVTFSEAVSAATAGVTGNYSIAGLSVSGVTVLSPTTVRLTTSQQTVGARYTVVVNNVADAANTPNLIAANSSREFGAWVLARGFLKFESYLGIPGVAVQALFDDPRFIAGTPDVVGFVSAFDSRSIYPTDANENYGARISGFFTPTQSGDYRFFSRSDDASQLFLSTNFDPANASQIAEEPGCCNGFLEPPAGQTSEPQSLAANTPYFIQLFYKEGGGGDFGQVAVRREGDATPAGSLLPIRGDFISTYADPDAASITIGSAPASRTGAENTTVTLTAAATGSPAPVVIQWQRAEPGSGTFADIAGARGASYTTPVLKQSTDDGARYRVEVRVPGGTVTSGLASIKRTDPATLTVIIDSTPPTIAGASSGANLKSVTLSFSEDMLATGLTTTGNYSVPGATISSATAINSRTVRLNLAAAMPQGTATTVTATGVRDSAGNEIVVPGNTFTFTTPVIVPGAATFEAFTGIGGVLPSDLRASPKFPNSPDVVRLVPGFELNGFGDNYGGRIKGFFTPTVSGNHLAYLAADDGAELWVSTDDSEANLRLVAVEPVFANPREWTGDSAGRRTEAAFINPAQFAPNISVPLNLTAGTMYYVEIIWKEGGGGDHGAALFLPEAETPENGALPTFGTQLATAIDPNLLVTLSLPLSMRSPLGSGGVTGFNARVHQVAPGGSTGLPTFIYRAEQQLAGIIDPNAADLSGAVGGIFQISGVINWNQDFASAEIGNFQSFSTPSNPDEPIPGVPGIGVREASVTDNIAAEIISYIEFPTPGVYFMGVNSDDGFSVTATDQPPANNLGLYLQAGGNRTGHFAISGGTDKGGVFRPITVPLTGKLVWADPPLADTALVNAAAIAGNIAVIERGVNPFSAKVQFALNAGAIGVIMVNNRDADSAEGKYPIVMGGSFVDLPAVMIGRPDGNAIRTALAAGEVTATIAPDTTPYLGSFDGGRGATDSTFAFNVSQAGLYPMRLVWFEGGGGANLEWFSVTPDGSKIPVNDRTVAGSLKAYRTRTFVPLAEPEVAAARDAADIVITFKGTLQSSATIDGTFSDVPGAVSPLRVPAAGSSGNLFYRARQ